VSGNDSVIAMTILAVGQASAADQRDGRADVVAPRLSGIAAPTGWDCAMIEADDASSQHARSRYFALIV
jgi:hypothetical protein